MLHSGIDLHKRGGSRRGDYRPGAPEAPDSCATLVP
jgi:hypothetical protein